MNFGTGTGLFLLGGLLVPLVCGSAVLPGQGILSAARKMMSHVAETAKQPCAVGEAVWFSTAPLPDAPFEPATAPEAYVAFVEASGALQQMEANVAANVLQEVVVAEALRYAAPLLDAALVAWLAGAHPSCVYDDVELFLRLPSYAFVPADVFGAASKHRMLCEFVDVRVVGLRFAGTAAPATVLAAARRNPALLEWLAGAGASASVDADADAKASASAEKARRAQCVTRLVPAWREQGLWEAPRLYALVSGSVLLLQHAPEGYMQRSFYALTAAVRKDGLDVELLGALLAWLVDSEARLGDIVRGAVEAWQGSHTRFAERFVEGKDKVLQGKNQFTRWVLPQLAMAQALALQRRELLQLWAELIDGKVVTRFHASEQFCRAVYHLLYTPFAEFVRRTLPGPGESGLPSLQAISAADALPGDHPWLVAAVWRFILGVDHRLASSGWVMRQGPDTAPVSLDASVLFYNHDAARKLTTLDLVRVFQTVTAAVPGCDAGGALFARFAGVLAHRPTPDATEDVQLSHMRAGPVILEHLVAHAAPVFFGEAALRGLNAVCAAFNSLKCNFVPLTRMRAGRDAVGRFLPLRAGVVAAVVAVRHDVDEALRMKAPLAAFRVFHSLVLLLNVFPQLVMVEELAVLRALLSDVLREKSVRRQSATVLNDLVKSLMQEHGVKELPRMPVEQPASVPAGSPDASVRGTVPNTATKALKSILFKPDSASGDSSKHPEPQRVPNQQQQPVLNQQQQKQQQMLNQRQQQMPNQQQQQVLNQRQQQMPNQQQQQVLNQRQQQMPNQQQQQVLNQQQQQVPNQQQQQVLNQQQQKQQPSVLNQQQQPPPVLNQPLQQNPQPQSPSSRELLGQPSNAVKGNVTPDTKSYSSVAQMASVKKQFEPIATKSTNTVDAGRTMVAQTGKQPYKAKPTATIQKQQSNTAKPQGNASAGTGSSSTRKTPAVVEEASQMPISREELMDLVKESGCREKEIINFLSTVVEPTDTKGDLASTNASETPEANSTATKTSKKAKKGKSKATTALEEVDDSKTSSPGTTALEEVDDRKISSPGTTALEEVDDRKISSAAGENANGTEASSNATETSAAVTNGPNSANDTVADSPATTASENAEGKTDAAAPTATDQAADAEANGSEDEEESKQDGEKKQKKKKKKKPQKTSADALAAKQQFEAFGQAAGEIGNEAVNAWTLMNTSPAWPATPMPVHLVAGLGKLTQRSKGKENVNVPYFLLQHSVLGKAQQATLNPDFSNHLNTVTGFGGTFVLTWDLLLQHPFMEAALAETHLAGERTQALTGSIVMLVRQDLALSSTCIMRHTPFVDHGRVEEYAMETPAGTEPRVRLALKALMQLEAWPAYARHAGSAQGVLGINEVLGRIAPGQLPGMTVAFACALAERPDFAELAVERLGLVLPLVPATQLRAVAVTGLLAPGTMTPARAAACLAYVVHTDQQLAHLLAQGPQARDEKALGGICQARGALRRALEAGEQPDAKAWTGLLRTVCAGPLFTLHVEDWATLQAQHVACYDRGARSAETLQALGTLVQWLVETLGPEERSGRLVPELLHVLCQASRPAETDAQALALAQAEAFALLSTCAPGMEFAREDVARLRAAGVPEALLPGAEGLRALERAEYPFAVVAWGTAEAEAKLARLEALCAQLNGARAVLAEARARGELDDPKAKDGALAPSMQRYCTLQRMVRWELAGLGAELPGAVLDALQGLPAVVAALRADGSVLQPEQQGALLASAPGRAFLRATGAQQGLVELGALTPEAALAVQWRLEPAPGVLVSGNYPTLPGATVAALMQAERLVVRDPATLVWRFGMDFWALPAWQAQPRLVLHLATPLTFAPLASGDVQLRMHLDFVRGVVARAGGPGYVQDVLAVLLMQELALLCGHLVLVHLPPAPALAANWSSVFALSHQPRPTLGAGLLAVLQRMLHAEQTELRPAVQAAVAAHLNDAQVQQHACPEGAAPVDPAVLAVLAELAGMPLSTLRRAVHAQLQLREPASRVMTSSGAGGLGFGAARAAPAPPARNSLAWLRSGLGSPVQLESLAALPAALVAEHVAKWPFRVLRDWLRPLLDDEWMARFLLANVLVLLPAPVPASAPAASASGKKGARPGKASEPVPGSASASGPLLAVNPDLSNKDIMFMWAHLATFERLLLLCAFKSVDFNYSEIINQGSPVAK